ncbi:uncharacterized protein LOC113399157 [Vanessa tameamea]|uniref:ascorbate ferrireductase (transmembrane) n=1 Tax=Vanessa tameamea TaxID=334116 RepID=A0A8B8ICS8_VANTA|nr:uncharacterized protein LOC113399157 [Vanessa tameamea]
MSENSERVTLLNESREFIPSDAVTDSSNNGNYQWMVFRDCMNTFVHSLIALSVFVTLCFAFQSIPLSAFQLHICLSVAGYQLLMSHGILSIACYNGWSSSMKHSHRRRSHWILQLAGSILAIAGSVIMIRHKTVNFNTVHGKLALAALTFTCVSLLNGVMTLYKVGVGNAVSSQTFKISHLMIGSSAFAVSSVCLSFGFIKESFRNWSSNEFAYIMIAITSSYTIIIVLKPWFTIISKLTNKVKSKIC